MKKTLFRLGILSIVSALMVVLGANVAFAGTTPAISNIAHKNGVARVLVEFNAPVWSDTAYTAGLAAADFQLGGTCGATSISSVSHAAGDDYAVLTVAGTLVADESACTIAAVANSIFTVGGALSEKTLVWDATADTTGPTITTATALDTEVEVMVTFNEPVYSAADGTGAIVAADLSYNDNLADNCTTVSGTALHVAGNNWVMAVCDAAVDATADIADALESMDVVATSVYDVFGNAAAEAQDVDITADSGVPALATHFAAKGEATEGGTSILLKLSEPVFNAAVPALADLVNADFTYVDTTETARVLSGTAQQTNDQEWVVLTVDTAFVAADLTAATADTIAAAVTSLYDAFAQTAATTAIALQDNTDPVILSVTFNQATGANTLAITYSEKIKLSTLTTGALTLANSTATVLDLSAAGTLQGIGAFGTVGTVTVPTTLNSAVLNSAETTITVTMAGATNGYINYAATLTAPSGTLTPEITGAGIQDKNPDTPNSIEITSIQSTITTTTAWDVTRPTVTAGVLSDAYLNANVSAAGYDGKVDKLVLTASETLKTVADAAGVRDDFTVTSGATEYGNALTITQASSSGTSYTVVFSGANIFYDDVAFTATAAADEWSLMDRAGNILPPTTKICMTGFTCTGGTANYAVITTSITKPDAADVTPPSKPTGVTATQTDDGKVKLSWADPTASDLRDIIILRGKNGQTITGTPYATVLKGVKTYTDSDVSEGDVLEYMLKATDSSGNASPLTDVVTITVENVVPVDETAPILGSVSATANNRVVVTFSDALDPSTAVASAFTITGGGADLAVSGLVLSEDSKTATLTTATQTASVAYTLTVAETVADVAGNTVAAATTGTFTGSAVAAVEDTGAPLVQKVNSVDGVTVEVVFNETMDQVTLVLEAFSITDADGGELEVTGVVAGSNKATLTTAPQTDGETYTVSVAATVKDIAGNTIAADTAGEFTYTAPAIEEEEEAAGAEAEVEEDTTGGGGTTVEEIIEVFEDVKKVEWAAPAIAKLYDSGVLKGKKEGEFAPSDNLNRAEAAAMLYRVLGLQEPKKPGTDPFGDVDKGAWHAGYIAHLKSEGIAKGNPDGTYAPGSSINRAEFLTLVVRVYKSMISADELKTVESYEKGTKTDKYADLADSWYTSTVTAATKLGIVSGSEKGGKVYFNAESTINRAEAAQMLFKAFGDMLD